MPLASPDFLETQDLFANPSPELTISSHTDLDFSQLLSAPERSSGNSSTPLVDISAPGPTCKQPCASLHQEVPAENVTTGLNFKEPNENKLIPKADPRNLSTKHSDRKSCEVCQKQFLRRYELQYVSNFDQFDHSQWISMLKCTVY